MAQMRQNFVQGGGAMVSGGMEGFGGGGGGPSSASMFDFNGQQAEQQQQYNDNVYAQTMPTVVAPEAPKVLAKSGMKLGGAGAGMGRKESLMTKMAAEDNLFPMAGMGVGKKAAGGASAFADLGAAVPKQAAAVPSTPLSLVLEEKIGVSMNREGSVESCEVKGTLTLTANTDAGVLALVAVNKATLPSSFNFATHPKVDKKAYEKDGVLSLKGGKGFPVGRGVGILRWSYNGEDAAPLTINCWPEDEGSGTINVNIEMELTRKDLTLYDVNILLPLGTTEAPAVAEMDGIYKHDARNGMICWHFDQVDASNATGSMEFSISGHDTDAFFPVQVGFRSETLLCPVQVASVTNSTTGAPIPNQITKSFVPENYQCA